MRGIQVHALNVDFSI